MRHSETLSTLDDGHDDDLTREFWGDSATWIARDRERSRAFQIQQPDASADVLRLDHTPASIRAVRDGIAAFRPQRRWRDDTPGPIERTREHGVVRSGRTAVPDRGPVVRRGVADSAPTRRRPSPHFLPHRDASIAELAAGQYDAQPPAPVHDVDLEPTGLIELTPSRESLTGRVGLAGVDPLVVRVGIVLLVVLLAIPLALSMRDDTPRSVETDQVGVVPAGAAMGVTGPNVDGIEPPATEDASATATPAETGPSATVAAPASTAAATTAGDAGSVGTGAATPGAAEEASSAPATAAEPAPADAPEDADAGRAAPLTESQDTAVVAEAATVGATAERAIPDCSLTYTAGAGDSWYRIADAAGVSPGALLDQNRATVDTVIFPGDEICLPAGATVPTPPTTTVAPTTVAPSTTTAPTTVAPPTPASPTEVQALIREIFPPELHEKALEIAWLESNYLATADNGWCCVGVFQIYWSVHRSWLDDYGIFERDDLKDARKNITAAYALYRDAGGWHPWSTA